MKIRYLTIILVLFLTFIPMLNISGYGPGFMITVPLQEPPLKQLKSGTPISEIRCDYYHTLVIRAEDNSPACLKFTTAGLLIERGWSDDSFITIMDPQYGDIQQANGMFTESYVVDSNMKKSNNMGSVLFQVYYPNGTQYKTDLIDSSSISPSGSYKYHVDIDPHSYKPISTGFKVLITYENQSKSIYLPPLQGDIPENMTKK